MSRSRIPRLLPVLAASLVLAGCGARGPRALPTVTSLPQQDAQSPGSAKYAIAPGGHVEVYHQGYGVRKAQGLAIPSMRIQVSVDNKGDKTMIFKGGESHLVDNRGDTLVLAAIQVNGQPSSSQVEIEPGSHRQIDLLYDLPPSYPLEKVDTFRTYWSYDLGGVKGTEGTMFVRKDPSNMFFEDARGKKHAYRYFMAVKT